VHTRPTIADGSIGPKSRESDESVRLSPITKYWAGGTASLPRMSVIVPWRKIRLAQAPTIHVDDYAARFDHVAG
jgi:hypothetical protein